MAFYIDIKVIPQSGRQICLLDKAGMMRCYLKSAPEAGKANQELITIIAKALSLPKQNITIVLGATSRSKRLLIDANIDREKLLKALGIEEQLTII